NKNNILFGLIGLFAGLVISFIVTNALYTGAVRAGNAAGSGAVERAEGTGAANEEEESSTTLSDEEIRAAIARADARADDAAVQRNFGLALYQYSKQTQETRYLPDIARFLKRAYDADPQDHDLTVSLASVYFDIGQSSDPASFDEARRYYLKALETKPDDASARARLGQTYYFGKPSDPKRAIVEYRKSLAADPRHEPALQNLASALITTGNREEAQKRIDELQKLNPSNAALPNLRAQLAQSKNAAAPSP
ncbi:MAG: tetratricopeptide repeat protein, partial [Pyrinomonadaceae bacterium]